MARGQYIRNEIQEVILYIAFVAFFGLLLPIISGLIGKGFSESFVSGVSLAFGSYLTNFIIYIPFLILAILIIIFPISRIVTLEENQDPATTPNPRWFRIFTESYLYNPEESGFLWFISDQAGAKKNFMRWSLNPLRVLIISVLVFGIYGMFLIGNPQIAVSGVPQLTVQQITPASDVTFGSFVPAFAENGTLMFIFMLFMGFNGYLCAKFGLSKWIFFGLGILVCILMGITWSGLHTLVYGNSDVALASTFVFGFIGSFITLLTGIWIFWITWHISNNMFRTLSVVVTNHNDVLFVTGIILFLILAFWIGIEIANARRRKGKKQSKYSMEQ